MRAGDGCYKSDIFRDVYRLAQKVSGLRWLDLYREIGLTVSDSPNARIIAFNVLGKGRLIEFEKFMVACKIAKIPRLMGAVLFAKAMIPEEHKHLRRNIGLTYKGIKEQSWPCTPDYVREYCKETCIMGAHMVPDEPDQCRSGMQLKPPRTRY